MHLDQTRGNTAATLSTHSTAPSVLHCTDRQHLRSTAAQPLGLRPPASARWAAVLVLPGVSGTLCCRRSSIRYVTAEAHGQGCGLRASTALLPEYRHPKEPAAPTVCVSASSSGGSAAFAESLTFPLRHLSDEIRRRYGGATFEIKKCNFILPGGIHPPHTSYKRATYAYRPRTDQIQMYGVRFHVRHIPTTHHLPTL